VALGPRLAAYSTTALAALALAPAAHATVIDITDFSVNSGSATTTPPSLTLVGSHATLHFQAGANGPFSRAFVMSKHHGIAFAGITGGVATSFGEVKLLHTNSVLNVQVFYSPTHHGHGSHHAVFTTDGPKTGYIGLKTQANGHTYYGWLRVKVTDESNSVALVPSADNSSVFGAYDISTDPNIGNFTAGEVAVPEPGEAAVGLGLLAFGAAGVREMRRRRVA
jgi:hypothetical protein